MAVLTALYKGECCAGVSSARRMQWKPCFNSCEFAPALLAKLALLKEACFASYQAQGCV